MEDLALDSSALEHDAHIVIERVDACLEKGLNRGRYRNLAFSVRANHREHLLDVERVARRGGGDSRAQPGIERRIRDEPLDQFRTLLVAERLEEQ